MRISCCFIALAALPALFAQPSPPTAYTVTQLGPGMENTIYRSGSKALSEATVPGSDGKSTHTRTLYDLQAHTTLSWDPADASSCGNGSFSGDWGDPFATSNQILTDAKSKGAKETGAETLNGIATKVMEVTIPEGKAKIWVDPKSGLAIKALFTPPTGAPMTLIEIKKFALGPPPPAIFALPAACAKLAAMPPPPTEKQKLAALTGSNPDDFVQAIMGPGSSDSCSIVFRVVHAGTMAPIAAGFQIALDPAVDMDHMPHYNFGVGDRWTFSGGGLHEVTAQARNGVLRIDNPKSSFFLDTTFGNAGDASAYIYKKCFAPQTVLLLVVKNPAKLSDGAEFLYAKSGKYATP